MYCGMLCCKRKRNTLTSLNKTVEEEKLLELSEDEEEMCKESGMSPFEVWEWKILLRKNIIQMDEYNLKMKEKKMREEQDRRAEQQRLRERELQEREENIQRERRIIQQMMDERLERRREEINQREEELRAEQQRLRAIEFELSEKNSILEIVFKMNETEEKFSIQIKKKAEEDANALMESREREIEEREREIAQRQQNLDERELRLEEKKTVLEIAIRINEFR